MTWPPTIGSQGVSARLTRAGHALRLDVQRHSLELTTGRAADPAAHLKGRIGPWAAVESRLDRISSLDLALRGAATLATSAQEALGRVAGTADTLRDRLLTVASGEAQPEALTRVGQAARAGLSAMISALSGQTAGRAVFSGTATDRGPLPDVDTFLSAVATQLAGITDATGIAAALDTFFESPGGPFLASLYAGGPAAAEPLAKLEEAELRPMPTAADPAIRGVLRGAVMAALLAEPGVVPDLGQRRQLAVIALERAPDDGEKLVSLRASLGDSEAAIDAARIRLSTERDALVRARTDFIGVDPYEAASRLEETRSRLEALYAVTARVSRLSLVEYLR